MKLPEVALCLPGYSYSGAAVSMAFKPYIPLGLYRLVLSLPVTVG